MSVTAREPRTPEAAEERAADTAGEPTEKAVQKPTAKAAAKARPKATVRTAEALPDSPAATRLFAPRGRHRRPRPRKVLLAAGGLALAAGALSLVRMSPDSGVSGLGATESDPAPRPRHGRRTGPLDERRSHSHAERPEGDPVGHLGDGRPGHGTDDGLDRRTDPGSDRYDRTARPGRRPGPHATGRPAGHADSRTTDDDTPGTPPDHTGTRDTGPTTDDPAPHSAPAGRQLRLHPDHRPVRGPTAP